MSVLTSKAKLKRLKIINLHKKLVLFSINILFTAKASKWISKPYEACLEENSTSNKAFYIKGDQIYPPK